MCDKTYKDDYRRSGFRSNTLWHLTLSRLAMGATLIVAAFIASGCSREAKIGRYLARADKFYHASDYEKAEIEYLNVLRLDRTNPAAVRHLGLMAFEQGRMGPCY